MKLINPSFLYNCLQLFVYDTVDIMEIEWITIGEAVALSNKSEQTIRRWVKSNVNDPSHVTNKPGNIRINKAKLAKSFILKNDQQNGGSKTS